MTFELALIPPLDRLADTLNTNMQLVLPHMYLTNSKYADHYQSLRKNGDFIILDNGAAETAEPLRGRDLTEAAMTWKSSELAVPDVLGNGKETVRLFKSFIKEPHFSDLLWHSNVRIGVVAQGQIMAESLGTIESIMASDGARFVQTVYLPRLLLNYNDPMCRIELARRINERWPHLQVHMFGAHTGWCSEAEVIRAHVERGQVRVRSMDTSMPYVFSMHNRTMNWIHPYRMGMQPKIDRPDNYFNVDTSGMKDLIDYNVDKMMEWVYGNRSSEEEAPSR